MQNKFKLRAKVLVSISSIKTLEKELRDFYDKKTRQKDAKAGKASRTKSETAEKVKAEKVNTTVKLETIINNTNNNNINIIEDNDEQINITKTKSKEQKFIDKLMKQAKKNNDKLLKKHKTKTETKTETKIETETETYIQQITFDDIFNDISNDISNNNPPRIVAIPNVVPQDNRQQITTSQYDYINKYIETESESDESDQLYDIYIVSINLLSNENYLNYICHNAGNHLQPHINGNTTMECKLNKLIKTKNYHTGPSQICRLTDKFNIFKIKWNRIIFDEAHEKLIPVVKLFSTSIKKYVQGSSGVKINSESQFLFENLCVLNSNYKWAITGTPTQNGIDNIMGIIEFLTKKNYEESNFVKLEKLRFLSDIVGISSDNMDLLLNRILKKTYKKDVKDLLNIPIFSEDIIYVEQTNIERNIYNTIRCSRHFTEAVKMKRLFLMCTNILINEGYDLDNNNEIATTEALTLEQLNTNMITKFNQQLVQLDKNKKQTENLIRHLESHIQEWLHLNNYIINYFNNLSQYNQIAPETLQELQDKFGDLDRPCIKGNCEIFYNLINVFEIWNTPADLYKIFIENIIMIKQHLYRIWKPIWQSENIINKCAEFGIKLGEIKIQEDIAKKRKQIETLDNDKKRINNQIALFSNNEFLKEKTSDPCIICFEPLETIVLTQCRHIFCLGCAKQMSNELKNNFNCPECRTSIQCNTLNITTVEMINKEPEPKAPDAIVDISNIILSPIENKLGADWKNKCINKYGSKMATLVEYLYKLFENKENRVIIFSQYDKMLRMIGITLEEYAIKFVYCCGNNYVLNKNINKFKKDDSIRVILLSSESANSGSNLTEANYIVMIDVLYDNIEKVKAMESQAIGRAVRLGQKLPVKVVRFITRGTVEEDHFNTNRYDLSILQN